MPVQKFSLIISRFPTYWDTLEVSWDLSDTKVFNMSKRQQHQRQYKHPERESGFHEQSDCQTSPEETQLLSFKNPMLNHTTNSNHVTTYQHHNKRLKQGKSSSVSNRRTKPPSPSPAHTDTSQFSFQSASTYGTAESSSSFPGSPPPALNVLSVTDNRESSTESYIGRTIENTEFVEEDPPQPEHDCKACGCERIRINVSGQYYELRVGLLNLHPDTLLGDPLKRQRFYDRVRDEFFIDRHRPSFEAIFAYFQYGGKLRRPHNVPDDIFLTEINFYELEAEVIEEYKVSEGYSTDDIVLPSNEMLKRIWMLFEYPETSNLAFVIAIISVIMTIASIVLFCVETLPVFSETHCVTDEAPNFLDPFFIIETTCTAWFTIELVVRFIACPSKVAFWKDFKNLVDLTAIVPYYVTFINVVSSMSCEGAKSSASLAFLRVIRLVRVFKLTKHSVGLQILILTFKASVEGLGLFLMALIVCLLVFSSAIYFAELDYKNDGGQINSIPDAFWWAIITMTTVGYGDKVPVGPLGKLIGSICAITGVLTLAIPVPIITGNFNRFYAHKTGRGRHT